MAAVAVVVTARRRDLVRGPRLAAQAGHRDTSVWDPATSFAQLVAAVVLTYALGGFAGAGWGLVLVLLPYFGVVFESTQLRMLAVGSGVAVVAAGLLAGTATAALVPVAVMVVAATVLGMWFTEQSATYMFEMRRQAQRQRERRRGPGRRDLRGPGRCGPRGPDGPCAAAHEDSTADRGAAATPSRQLRAAHRLLQRHRGQRAGVGGADSWGW